MLMIEIEGLNRYFKSGGSEHQVLKNIDLSVKKGECIVLKGISGSGKTTLMSIMAGVDRPTSGKVLVCGEAIAKLPDKHISLFRAKKIGMIFQSFNLLDHLTALENVIVPTIPMGYSQYKAEILAKKALEMANIDHKSYQRVINLSGGEKQRVVIARAMVADPEVTFCDEPTANLDHGNSLGFMDIISKFHRLGKTVVIATHDPLFEELKIPHRIVLMEDGRIVESG